MVPTNNPQDIAILQSATDAGMKTNTSQPEHLQLVDVADRQPLLLQVRPGQVGYLVVSLVLEQRGLVLHSVAARSQVPDVSLAVVAYRAHVDGRLGSPGHRIDAVFVVAETHDGNDWFSRIGEEIPRVDHGDVVGLHLDAGQEAGVGLLSVPGQFKDRPTPFSLILHRGMLQVPDIELPDAAVCSHTGEDVPFFGEVDVVDFFVVGDQLREDGCLFDVPDGAGGVDGAGADQVVQLGVPVEGSQGG